MFMLETDSSMLLPIIFAILFIAVGIFLVLRSKEKRNAGSEMSTHGKAKFSYSIPRVWRWVGGIVLMLLILLIAATVGIRAWKPSIKAKLTEAIQQSSDGLYGLTYDDMELHILT